jgi:hypothetical protein
MSSGIHVSHLSPKSSSKILADENPDIKHAFHALALDERRQPFLPTLYYIPSEDSIAEENKILAKDEVDWPELTEHRQRIDAELQEQKAAQEPHLAQVWFTGEQEIQYLVLHTDLLYRRPYQRRRGNRRGKDRFRR